jgi:GntR family transcriptional repressor for pyruvate dehydrogenase complex
LNETRFAKLDVQPAYRHVFDAIEKDIVSGRLKPGDRLPAEMTLAEQFGVNRSTVREGIRLLENSGLVRREGGKRLFVTLPHYLDLASRASRALVLHQATFRELWEAAIAIEPVTVGHAAERITASELDRLEETVVAMADATGDVDRFVRLDIAFHDLIATASRNRALELAREPLSLLFLPAGRAILPRLGTHRRVIDAHKAILEAMRQRDAEGARDWMRRHMADFKRGYERTGLDMDEQLDLASMPARDSREYGGGSVL